MFGVNYNNLPEMHRKGTVLVWEGGGASAAPKECGESDLFVCVLMKEANSHSL